MNDANFTQKRKKSDLYGAINMVLRYASYYGQKMNTSFKINTICRSRK